MFEKECQAAHTYALQSVKLLKELSGFYHYDLEITSGGEIRMTSQRSDSVAVKEYATAEHAIGAWLSTMLSTNRSRVEAGQAPMWTAEEIALAQRSWSRASSRT